MHARSNTTALTLPRPPDRLVKVAWPHAWWLVLGCIALFVRLPFSLAQVRPSRRHHPWHTPARHPAPQPHFVSETLQCLINGDLDGARWNIVYLAIAGNPSPRGGALPSRVTTHPGVAHCLFCSSTRVWCGGEKLLVHACRYAGVCAIVYVCMCT